MTPEAYLDLVLTRGENRPNFFMAVPYIKAARWRIEERAGVVTVRDVDGLILPPVSRHDGSLLQADEPVRIDLEGYAGRGRRELFDLEVLYDPASFRDLSGGARKTLRKNTARFWRENPDALVVPCLWGEPAARVLGAWLEGGEEEIHDGETILRYVQQNPLQGLSAGGRLVAVWAWDENSSYVNFRYLFADPEVPFADEAGRLAMMLWAAGRGKLVNDGGTLGREGLLRFKQRLGPVEIRERYSWL